MANGRIQRGIACTPSGRGGCGRRCRRGPDRGNRRSVGDGIRQTQRHFGLRGGQSQLLGEGVEPPDLGVVAMTVGLNRTDRHLVGEGARLGARQAGHRVRERTLFEQNPLNQERSVGDAEVLQQRADLGPFGVGFVTIAKGGRKGDQGDALFFTVVHAKNEAC